MLIVISPAKTLDYSSPVSTDIHTQPRFLEEAAALNKVLRKYTARRLANLMSVSKDIAELNAQRNAQWAPPFTLDNARQAIFAFKGDVYLGMDSAAFSAADLAWAQDHLRILSGLYGLLRPLDLMQAYRLEMGTTLRNPGGKNLYRFWNDRLAAALAPELQAQQHSVLVNLASQEYFAALDTAALQADVVTPVFRDYKNGAYKVISFFAKKARGTMASWIIRERLEDPADLQGFTAGGYHYSAGDSGDGELVFLRRAD